MKFSTEEEKQAYLDNLKKMVADITKVEPDPACPGYTIEEDDFDVANFCLKLENMIKEIEDPDVKLEIIRTLRVVEAFYEEQLSRRIGEPFPTDTTWQAETINWLQQSLNKLDEFAPTIRTCELYCAYVYKYSQLLQNAIDLKTPGHPACTARYEKELRGTIVAGQEMAARLGSPIHMLLPRDPNVPDNITRVLTFSPGETDVQQCSVKNPR